MEVEHILIYYTLGISALASTIKNIQLHYVQEKILLNKYFIILFSIHLT